MKTTTGFILFFLSTIFLLADSPEQETKDAFLRADNADLQAYDCVSHHAKSLSVNVFFQSEKDYQEKMNTLRECESHIREQKHSFPLTEKF